MRWAVVWVVLLCAAPTARAAADEPELRAQLDAMARVVARYEQWSSCLRIVRTHEYGDPLGGDGYRFDAHDGTGLVYRTAIALAPDAPPGDATFDLLELRGEGVCVAARMPARVGSGVPGLRRAARAIERAVRRFDAWESCLAQVPVSELGDPRGRFGYLYGAPGAEPRPRPALSIEHVDPEDPDYLLLARASAGPCDHDDEETAPDDRRHGLAGLAEDVADLREPVADLDRFDRCMYTVGLSERGSADGGAGYVYGRGGTRRMPALTLVLGERPARYAMLAFPPEEPPGIECDEDAGGDDEDDD